MPPKTTPPILFDLHRNSQTQPVVARFTGQGNLYVWTRDRGELVSISDNYMPVAGTRGGKSGVNLIKGGVAGTVSAPGAYSPQTGLAYSASARIPGYFEPRDEKRGEGQFGNIAAINTIDGAVVWTEQTEIPVRGGLLATAGGLVFAGRGSSWFDAYDAVNGKRLWSFRTGAGCDAAPVTYRIAGRQYIAVACGGHAAVDLPGGDAVIAFALPDGGPR